MNRLRLIKNQLSNTKETILVQNANGNKAIKIVTMNTPLNPISQELGQALYDTLLRIDADEETKVIILTGNGKAFVAGADIKYMGKIDYPTINRNKNFLSSVEFVSYHITKPIIAAVNGLALGGGFELALACDIIIASEKSSFAFPELKLGLFPGAGGSQRLAKLMGIHKAMEYILTTKEIPLSELKSFGVINDVVPHDQLIGYTIKMAEIISKFSTMSVFAAKKAIKLSEETGLFAGLRGEKFIFDGIFNTQDKQIGIDAFINKKTPEFKDK